MWNDLNYGKLYLSLHRFSRWQIHDIFLFFFFFFSENRSWHFISFLTICMTCKSLFSWEKTKHHQFIICWINPESGKDKSCNTFYIWRSVKKKKKKKIKRKGYQKTSLLLKAPYSSKINFLSYHLPSICRCPSTPLNNFSSETPGPSFFKLHVEHSVKVGLKICSNDHGPLIKMATMPIYRNS